MRVLVCGGRDFKDWQLLHAELDNLKPPATHIIHGTARGADKLASDWAQSRNIPETRFRAEWEIFGRAAGPLRNQKMLMEGKPDLVVAFPGSAGTADMVRRAKAAGVRVIELT